MATTDTNTVKQAVRSVITLAGIQNALENNLGITPKYDVATTINSLYNVFPTITPTQRATEQYFGIGIGGDYPDGATNFRNPQELSATNLGLYNQVPFRIRPVEDDLTSAERDQYRIRAIKNINGQLYACYYLKKFILSDTQVQFSKFDPSRQADQPYTIDPSQLNPKPPATPVDGAVTNVTEEITASVNGTLPITGAEVFEMVNVLFNGDPRAAVISEIGIYTGVDMQQQATAADGSSFSYTEAIYARLSQAHTFIGKSFFSPESYWTPSFKFTSANMCVSQNDLAGSSSH